MANETDTTKKPDNTGSETGTGPTQNGGKDPEIPVM